MNNFREWLSDNLRYFLLGIGIVCVGIAIFFGVRAVNTLSREAKPQNEAFEIKIQDKDKTDEQDKKKEEAANKGEDAAIKAQDSEEVFISPEAKTEEPLQEPSPRETPAVQENQEQADQNQTANEHLQEEPQQEESAPAASENPEQAKENANLSLPGIMHVVSACNLRPNPGYEGGVLGEVPAGSQVEVVEDAKGWYKIRFNGMEGYVGARFVAE